MSNTNNIRLANIYLEQADTARRQGNIEASIEHFGRAINIYKKLADNEPACWELVADTIERAAATYKAAGKLKEAEEAFAEAAQLREAIAKRAEQEADEG
jgi:tetratricopeptide (TPR) repeat protein